MKIDPYEINTDFERSKEYVRLLHKMEDGEITEDDFNEEIQKLKNSEQSLKTKIPIDQIDEVNVTKKDNEGYKEYFSGHKKEFRNILGI